MPAARRCGEEPADGGREDDRRAPVALQGHPEPANADAEKFGFDGLAFVSCSLHDTYCPSRESGVRTSGDRKMDPD
jgi:hypothetical protein